MVEQQHEEEKLLSVSEEVHEMMTVVSSRVWMVLACCGALLAILLVWAFLGVIPIKVGGWGILLSPTGTRVIDAQTTGTVLDIHVFEGQDVKSGDVILTLTDPRAYLDIQLQKDKVVEAKASLSQTLETVSKENQARRLSVQKRIDATELTKKNALSRIPYLEQDLAAKKRLAEKGVLARPDVERSNSELLAARNSIEASNAELAALQAELSQSYRQGDIEHKENALSDAEDALSRLLLVQTFTEVKAPRTGKILEIEVGPGQRVDPGALLASMEPLHSVPNELKFYGLISAEYGVLVKEGQNVQIEVAGISPKSYGYLLGTIVDISPFPVSNTEIFSVVPNNELAQFLKNNNVAVYALYVKPLTDPTSTNGFKWTNKKGPPFRLESGTLGVGRIIVEERHPIFYILPEVLGPYVQEKIPLTTTNKTG